MTVTVLPEDADRAAKLAGVMTADREVTGPDGGAWTAQDVLAVAIGRGLDALERAYPVAKNHG